MSASITAIIPTRDSARFLPEAVHSLMAQSRLVHQIIVWDDGSTDETGQIATQLQDIISEAPADSNVPTFVYRKSDRAGTGAAINQALALASGDYVWICSAQNRTLPHGAETLARLLDDAPDATYTAGTYRRFKIDPRSRKQTDLAPAQWPDLRQGVTLRLILENRFLPLDAVMFRRSALIKAGPFREDIKGLCHYDMHIRLACQGPIRVTDEPVFLQRIDADKSKQTATSQNPSERAVLKPLRDRIPLAIYEGMFRAEDPMVVRRTALLQRACVFARSADWATATRDFVDAAKLAPGFRLSALEKDICSRAFSGNHGVATALDAEVRASLREAASMSAAGGSIARALAAGMAWRSKDAMARGRLSDVASMGKFISALRIYTGGHGRGEKPGQVSENDELPVPAYKVI